MAQDLEDFSFPAFSSRTVDPESPVYPSLMSMMKADLVINPDSDVWLIHDRPLPELMKWIEYDIELETLILVAVSGKIQGFGQKVAPAMKKYLRKAKQVYLIRSEAGVIHDMGVLPLIVRKELKLQ